MKSTFLTVLLFVWVIPTGNCQDPFAKRFGAAVEFLQSNEKLLASKWKELKPKTWKDYKKDMKEGLKVKVLDTLAFRSPMAFFSDFDGEFTDQTVYTSNCDSLGAYNNSIFLCKHPDFVVPSFQQVIRSKGADQEAPFLAGFSKVYKSFTICQIWTKMENNIVPRFAESLVILFRFDSDGNIKKVYYGNVVR